MALNRRESPTRAPPRTASLYATRAGLFAVSPVLSISKVRQCCPTSLSMFVNSGNKHKKGNRHLGAVFTSFNPDPAGGACLWAVKEAQRTHNINRFIPVLNSAPNRQNQNQNLYCGLAPQRGEHRGSKVLRFFLYEGCRYVICH